MLLHPLHSNHKGSNTGQNKAFMTEVHSQFYTVLSLPSRPCCVNSLPRWDQTESHCDLTLALTPFGGWEDLKLLAVNGCLTAPHEVLCRAGSMSQASSPRREVTSSCSRMPRTNLHLLAFRGGCYTTLA